MTRPEVRPPDYSFLPGEEHNPLMKSTVHVDWCYLLVTAARHALAGTDHLVTGNVVFAPDDGGPDTAPDLMVIPGLRGTDFERYEPGPRDPMPSVCVTIRAAFDIEAEVTERCRRLLRLGIGEVYTIDLINDRINRIELDGNGGSLIESDAIGRRSEALRLNFARVDGRLGVMLPAGRVVFPGDNPFTLLVEARARADAAAALANG